MSLSTLTTERLVLRPLKEEDAPAIFLLRSDEASNKYVDRPKATSIEDAKGFINKISGFVQEGKTFYRAVTLKDDDQLIGTITLWNFDSQKNKAEIGYELLPLYQGKGYMLEAVKAIIEVAFTHFQLSAVEGWTHPENVSSNNLLEKLGFKRDHEAEKRKPEDAIELIYTLNKNGHS